MRELISLWIVAMTITIFVRGGTILAMLLIGAYLIRRMRHDIF